MGNSQNTLTDDVSVLLVHFPPWSTNCSAITSTKLFKTAKCIDQQTVLFVKIFAMQGLDEKNHYKNFEYQNNLISKSPQRHLIVSALSKSENLGVLYRPFIHYSLRQKITRPPFLNQEEKIWTSFLALKAVQQMHDLHLVHGDIRPENFLLTSWDWVFLADFGFYKPLVIPEGNLTVYNLFFAPGKREACYLAPERFETKNDKSWVEMKSDIFSLGCVLTEIFLDGECLFTLPQILNMKKTGIEDIQKLLPIDEKIQELIRNMICVSPIKRWDVIRCLNYYLREVMKDEVCLKLYEFSICVLKINNADERVKMVADFIKEDYPKKFSIVLLSLLTSCILNVSCQGVKIECIKLMKKLDLSDEVKLHRIIPYLTYLLNKEEKARVKTTVLIYIAKILKTVKTLNLKDIHLFKECIWPAVFLCKNDEDDCVRHCLATLVPTYGQIGRIMLEIGTSDSTLRNFDIELKDVGKMIGKIYKEMMDTREEIIQLVLLSNFPYFASYYSLDVSKGIFKEVILPWLIYESKIEDVSESYIQIEEKYQIAVLRESEKYIEVFGDYFFYHTQKHLENNLYGRSETLVYLTLKALNFHSQSDRNLLEKALPLIIHPSKWIRDEMKKLIKRVISQLDPSFNFIHIRPMILPYLKLENVYVISSNIIEAFLHPPISRSLYLSSILKNEIPAFEHTLQGMYFNLASMVKLPYYLQANIKILEMPEEKTYYDENFQTSYIYTENLRRNNSIRSNLYEGLGISGELDHVINAHNDQAIVKLLQTNENMILSASSDGNIIMWKFSKPDDYTKIKYKEKKETLSKPINLGNCGDYIYICYDHFVKIWDQEFSQIEQEFPINELAQATDISQNLLIIADKQGNLYQKDLRDPKSHSAQSSKNLIFSFGAQKGIISQISKTSENSIALGSLSGHIIHFDLRFNIPTSAFYNSFKQPILSMATYSCKYKPIIDGSQLLTALSDDIVMWDLASERASVLLTRKKSTSLTVPYLVPDRFYYQDYSPEFFYPNDYSFFSIDFSLKLEKLEIYSKISKNFVTNLTEFGALVKNSCQARLNVRKILNPLDSNLLLSAGDDGLIRIWDPVVVRNSGIVGLGGITRPEYASAVIPDLLVIQEQPYVRQGVKPRRRDFNIDIGSRKFSQNDPINDVLFTQFPKPLLLAGCNDGTIRIWR